MLTCIIFRPEEAVVEYTDFISLPLTTAVYALTNYVMCRRQALAGVAALVPVLCEATVILDAIDREFGMASF